jgi:multimeric flavodoxin WrbA
LAGLILATPVYFGGMTAQAKAFLDRCVPLRRNGFMLRNKVGGVLAVGGARNGGQELTIQMVHAAMLVQDMIIVSDGLPTSHFGGTCCSENKPDISGDEYGLTTAANLGRRVAEVAAKLHGA